MNCQPILPSDQSTEKLNLEETISVDMLLFTHNFTITSTFHNTTYHELYVDIEQFYFWLKSRTTPLLTPLSNLGVI